MSGEPERPNGVSQDAPPAESAEATAGRDWPRLALEEIVRPLVIAAMIGCIAISLTQLVGLVAPEWGGALAPVLAFLVALESIHSQRFGASRLFGQRAKQRVHLVEAVILLLVVRLAMYARPGAPRLVDDVALWAANPGRFLNFEFIVLALVLGLFWAAGFVLSQTFQELEASVFERAPAITDPRYDLWVTGAGHRRTDRQALLRRISGIFAAGGLVMLVFTGIARVDLRALVAMQRVHNSDIIVSALVYFLLGFFLVSQAQYATLRANWQLERIPIASMLGRRWLLWAVAFLLVVAAVAALLPVNYSADMLYAAARWVSELFSKIALALILVFTLVISWLSRLFGGGASEQPAPEATPTPELEITPPPVPHEPWLWWQAVRSVLFWVVLIGIVGYSLYHFVGDRWGIWPRLRMSRLFTWLGGLFRGLSRAGRKAVQRLRVAVEQRLSARRERQQQRRPRYLALGRLSPRERVRYLYLSIVERSARQGLGRPPAMTPLEYERLLSGQLPEAAAEVQQLTQAFLEARYSAHTFERADERPVRVVWQRLKQALALRRRTPPTGS